MKTNQTHLQTTIDESLHKVYHQICFDSSKKYILNRLITPDNTSNTFSKQEQHPGASLDNRMINEYISNLYEKYNIEDPIKKLYRLANVQMIVDQKLGNSVQNSLNMTQVTDRSKLSVTKKKLLNLRESYRRDNYDAVSVCMDEEDKFSPEKSKIKVVTTTPNRKQIGYKTKQKINFKNTKTESSQIYSSFPSKPQNFNQMLNLLQKTSISRISDEVPVIFRYCPMCQQIILQHNIRKHESICLQIQKAYNLSNKQLLEVIHGKIKRMESEIQLYIVHQLNNKQHIMAVYMAIMKAAYGWLNNCQNFSLLKSQLKRFSISFYDNVMKLNYFRQLYSKISKETNDS